MSQKVRTSYDEFLVCIKLLPSSHYSKEKDQCLDFRCSFISNTQDVYRVNCELSSHNFYNLVSLGAFYIEFTRLVNSL